MPCYKLEFKLAVMTWALLLTLALNACQSSTSTPPSMAALPAATATPDKRAIIVALGDSLSAGFGLPAAEAFTTLLQQRLDEKGYAYRVVNASISGDTSAGGVRRLEWSLEGDVKLLLLELGANDGLRGLPVAELRKNLAQIIEMAQQRKIQVVLAGMEAPPNLGAAYASQFRQVYRDLARQYGIPLIPFLLDGVGGKPELNQPDGIHPNAMGERLMTDNVWRVLEPFLK